MEQSINARVVVGDRIKQQLKDHRTVSISNFLTDLNNANAGMSGKQQIYIGQGLSEQQRQLLFSKISNLKWREHLLINETEADFKKASSELTHKQVKKNIMITEPVKMSATTYKSNLIIDDHCSEMSDHLTGNHLQATVLIEAARQMNTAVTEKFLINSQDKEKFSFVLNKLESQFHQYIFPFQVELQQEIKKIRKLPNGNLQASTVILFIQEEIKCAEFNFDFMVLDKKVLESNEQAGIDRILKKLK